MTSILSPNTQAILLLTAPLIVGRGLSTPDLLTPGEYKRLARHLREIERQPSDLVSPDASGLLCDCHPVIDATRLQRLLERGFLLSQVVERWQARAIWVVSRADPNYPKRLKTRLRENAPAILYGCGDIGLLDSGGLAVEGSRHAGEALINYTLSIGRLTAHAGRTLVSGGARGIDQAAMRGALEAGGKVCGVLADSLEKTTLSREYRNLLLEERLTLISPYDPNAGFSVGNAMQRNKLIYALADASLVVCSDINKGGTWAGAVEQLDKLKFAPVYVRSTGEPSPGLDALRKKGALAWPNPQDTESFEAVLSAQPPAPMTSTQAGLTLAIGSGAPEDDELAPPASPELAVTAPSENESKTTGVDRSEQINQASADGHPVGLVESTTQTVGATPAEAVFAAVRKSIQQILIAPMKDAEVAAALGVSTAQAKAWLQRLLDEGVLEKQKKPAGYVIKVIKQKQLI